MEPASGHTPFHVNCPACDRQRFGTRTQISPDTLYPTASEIWMQSRNAAGSKRARYVSQRSLKDFREYNRALLRFFAGLTLEKIHPGHIRQYQEDRAAGRLGPTREETLARIKDEVKADAFLKRARKQAEKGIGPNKINQELGMLKRILQRAGLWSEEFEENYQPLQHEHSDIQRAMSPEQQDRFIHA